MRMKRRSLFFLLERWSDHRTNHNLIVILADGKPTESLVHLLLEAGQDFFERIGEDGRLGGHSTFDKLNCI